MRPEKFKMAERDWNSEIHPRNLKQIYVHILKKMTFLYISLEIHYYIYYYYITLYSLPYLYITHQQLKRARSSQRLIHLCLKQYTCIFQHLKIFQRCELGVYRLGMLSADELEVDEHHLRKNVFFIIKL